MTLICQTILTLEGHEELLICRRPSVEQLALPTERHLSCDGRRGCTKLSPTNSLTWNLHLRIKQRSGRSHPRSKRCWAMPFPVWIPRCCRRLLQHLHQERFSAS